MINRAEQFKLLNEHLKEENQDLLLICAGGYVLEREGIRSTKDIDAFYQSEKKIEGIISQVGTLLGYDNLEEEWLNNSIQNLNPKPPIEICHLDYEYSNLKVYSVPINYLIGMKLSSQREQDLEDVSLLIKKESITDADELLEILDGYGFNIDESILLESFSGAYGIDWLIDYYKKKEKNLKNNLLKDRNRTYKREIDR